MFHISRIRLVRVGHSQAWFPDVTIHTTDLRTNEPCDTILFASNGDGKSTLLSLVFSCFQTRTDKFLKHLSKSSHRFEDYFGRHPGLIIVEWTTTEAALFPEGRSHLITGQVVARDSTNTEKTNRLFFLFNGGNELNFDAIPFSLQEFPNFEAVRRWAVKTSDRHRTELGFFHTEVQDAWRICLRDRGIDVDMLEKQVEFSVTEGEMESEFLSFCSEDDFVRKFFDLTLSPDSDRVCAELSTYVDKLRMRPNYRQRLVALEGFSPAVSSFKDAAAAWEAQVHELLDHRTNLLRCGAGLSSRSMAYSQQRERQTSVQIATKSREQQLVQSKTAVEAEIEAIDQEFLERSLKEAIAQCTLASSNKQAIVVRQNSIEAARIDLEIREQRAALNELDKSIEIETQDLRPREIEVGQIGFQFQAAIQKCVRNLQQEAADATNGIALAEQRETAANQSFEEADSQFRAALKAKEAAAGFVARHQEELQDLINHGIIAESESPRDASARWQETCEGLRRKVRQAEAGIPALDANIQDVQARATALATPIADRHLEIRRLQRFLSDAEVGRTKLSCNKILCRLMEAENVDPDSRTLGDEFAKALHNIHTERAQSQCEFENLVDLRERLENTRLAFANPDVTRIIELLTSSGIAARPFVDYVAEHVKDQNASRELVLSDPARFLGVRVSTPEEVEKVRRMLGEVSLRQPVVVSLGVLDPRPAVPNVAAIGPAHNADFNYEAAAELRNNVEGQYQNRKRQTEELNDKCSTWTSLENELSDYLARFVGQNRSSAENSLLEIETDWKALLSTEESLKEQLQNLRESLRHVQSELRVLDANVNSADVHFTDCNRLALRSQQAEDALARLAAATNAENAAVDRRSQSLNDVRAAASEKIAFSNTLRDANTRITHLKGEAESIDVRAETGDAPSSDPLDVLRQKYLSARDSLLQLQRERVDILVERREQFRKRLEGAQTNRARARSPLDEQIVQNLAVFNDYELARQLDALNEGLAKAEQEVLGTTRKEAVAQTALHTFVSKRSYRTFSIATLESESDAAISVRRDKCLARENELSQELGQVRQMFSELEEQILSLKESSKLITERIEEIKRSLGEADFALAVPIEMPASHSDLRSLLDVALMNYRASEQLERKAQETANEQMNSMKAAASRLLVTDQEKPIADHLLSAPLSETCKKAQLLYTQIVERIEALREQLAQFDSSMKILTGSLDGLLTTAIRILNRATTVRIPDDVPAIAGLPVLKMSFRSSGIPQGTARDAHIGNYIDALVERAVLPRTSAALSSELLRHMIGGDTARFGLQVLKPKDFQPDQYMPVDKVTTSGGEGLTTAILLYAVLAQLRAEQLAVKRRANGGILILDNPLGKANKNEFIKAQRSMARALGLQLIYATGLADYNSLGEFERFWRMRPARRGQQSGTIHMEVESMDLQVAAAAK